MDLTPLSFRSSLEQYQKQAEELLQGYKSGDSEAIRSVMRRLALNRYPAATIRFAKRLQALSPGDNEARMVLQMLQRGEDASRVTTPVEHDIPW